MHILNKRPNGDCHIFTAHTHRHTSKELTKKAHKIPDHQNLSSVKSKRLSSIVSKALSLKHLIPIKYTFLIKKIILNLMAPLQSLWKSSVFSSICHFTSQNCEIQ